MPHVVRPWRAQRDEPGLNPLGEFRKLPMDEFSFVAVRSARVRVRARVLRVRARLTIRSVHDVDVARLERLLNGSAGLRARSSTLPRGRTRRSS
jgi:hypothetical protein